MKDGDIGRALRDLVVAWLAWHEGLDKRERSAELTERVEGYRIVNGGQVDGDSWEITDAETGELLARGEGLASYNAAWQDSWVHVDAIHDDVYRATSEPDGDFGLPPRLAGVLVEWVVDRPDEARQFIAEG